MRKLSELKKKKHALQWKEEKCAVFMSLDWQI